jgi:hypothetical protein
MAVFLLANNGEQKTGEIPRAYQDSFHQIKPYWYTTYKSGIRRRFRPNKVHSSGVKEGSPSLELFVLSG